MSTVMFLEGYIQKWKYIACCMLLVSLDVFQNTASVMNLMYDFLM